MPRKIPRINEKLANIVMPYTKDVRILKVIRL